MEEDLPDGLSPFHLDGAQVKSLQNPFKKALFVSTNQCALSMVNTDCSIHYKRCGMIIFLDTQFITVYDLAALEKVQKFTSFKHKLKNLCCEGVEIGAKFPAFNILNRQIEPKTHFIARTYSSASVVHVF